MGIRNTGPGKPARGRARTEWLPFFSLLALWLSGREMMLIEPMLNKMSMFQSGAIGLVVPMEQLASLVIQTLVFAVIGVLIFTLAFWIIVKATPFSVRKEIEEDHNVAIAIVIGAVIIGIALVISAAIQG
jgi:uncharacterized membrane protein YjfL (UPF0719 family)